MNFNHFVSLKDYKIKNVVFGTIFIQILIHIFFQIIVCSMDEIFSGFVNALLLVHALGLKKKNLLGYNDEVFESMILPFCQLPVREILKSQGTMTVCGCLLLAHCSLEAPHWWRHSKQWASERKKGHSCDCSHLIIFYMVP